MRALSWLRAALLLVVGFHFAPTDALSVTLVGGGGGSGIEVFQFANTSGILQTPPLNVTDPSLGGGWIAWAPTWPIRTVYIAQDNEIVAASLAPDNSTLTEINRASSGGSGCAHLSVDPTGQWVLTSNYGSGHIATLKIRPDGGLDAPVTVLLAGANAHMIITDSSGLRVFVPCLGVDWIAQYTLNLTSGALTPGSPPNVSVTPGAGPRHMTFHPTLPYAYVLNELGSTLATFSVDTATGWLKPAPVAYSTTLPPGVNATGQSAGGIVVSPDGAFVYATNRFVANATAGANNIAIFAINATSGEANLTAWANGGYPGALWVPRYIGLAGDGGRWLLVASQKNANVTVFERAGGGATLVANATYATQIQPTFFGVLEAPSAAPQPSAVPSASAAPSLNGTASASSVPSSNASVAPSAVGTVSPTPSFLANGTVAASPAASPGPTGTANASPGSPAQDGPTSGLSHPIVVGFSITIAILLFLCAIGVPLFIYRRRQKRRAAKWTTSGGGPSTTGSLPFHAAAAAASSTRPWDSMSDKMAGGKGRTAANVGSIYDATSVGGQSPMAHHGGAAAVVTKNPAAGM